VIEIPLLLSQRHPEAFEGQEKAEEMPNGSAGTEVG